MGNLFYIILRLVSYDNSEQRHRILEERKKNRIQQIPKNEVSYSKEDQEKKSSELNLI